MERDGWPERMHVLPTLEEAVIFLSHILSQILPQPEFTNTGAAPMLDEQLTLWDEEA